MKYSLILCLKGPHFWTSCKFLVKLHAVNVVLLEPEVLQSFCLWTTFQAYYKYFAHFWLNNIDNPALASLHCPPEGAAAADTTGSRGYQETQIISCVKPLIHQHCNILTTQTFFSSILYSDVFSFIPFLYCPRLTFTLYGCFLLFTGSKLNVHNLCTCVSLHENKTLYKWLKTPLISLLSFLYQAAKMSWFQTVDRFWARV